MEKKRQVGINIMFVIISLVLAAAGTVSMAQQFAYTKQTDAYAIAGLAERNIVEIFTDSQNEAALIAENMEQDPDNVEIFRESADRVLTQTGISKVYLIEGTTVTEVVSIDSQNNEVGMSLSEFPYVFNIAKLVKETVVEGPIKLVSSESTESFVFIEPLLSGEEYLGEVVVAVEAEYIVGQLPLTYLEEMGYDYELWRIDSQDGEKRVAAASDEGKDMSDAIRTTFYVPTEWTLAIAPKEGWLTVEAKIVTVLVGVLILFALLAFSYLVVEKHEQRMRDFLLKNKDGETGIFNRTGFVKDINKRLRGGLKSYTLLLFVMDEYIPLARILDEKQKKEYLEHVVKCLGDYETIPHTCCRIGESCYAVAVLDELTDAASKDLAKELALTLLWKTEVHGRREYINAKWRALRYPQDGADANQLIEKALKMFDESYKTASQE